MSIFSGSLSGQTLAGTALAGTTLAGITLEGNTLHDATIGSRTDPCQADVFDPNCPWHQVVADGAERMGDTPAANCDKRLALPNWGELGEDTHSYEGCEIAKAKRKWPYYSAGLQTVGNTPDCSRHGTGWWWSDSDEACIPPLQQKGSVPDCKRHGAGYVWSDAKGECVPPAGQISVASNSGMIVGAVVLLGIVAAVVASSKKKSASRWELAMYASIALAPSPAIATTQWQALPRDPAIGARLNSLRAFWPRSQYLSAIVPQGFAAAAESDPRASLEALLNQVLDAHAEATRAIDRNGGSVKFSSTNASRALDTIAAWRNDNAAELDAISKLPGDTVVPEHLRIKMPPAEAKALVASLWITAHSGIGLYETGAVMQAMEQGEPDWTYAKVKADLDNRLVACRILLGMDAEGSLGASMNGQPNASAGVAGLGNPLTGLQVAIIIGIVAAIVGLFSAYLYFGNQNYEQKQRIEAQKRLCDEAKSKNDRPTIEACNKSILEQPFHIDPSNVAILTAGSVVFLFLFTRFVIPYWLDKRT